MSLNFQQLFIKIEITEVPNNLRSLIIQNIALYEKRMRRRKAMIEGTVSALSLASIIIFFDVMNQSLVQSGFYQYLQLIFSEDVSIFSYWKELGFTLLESLPVLTLAIFLAGMILFVWSGLRAAKRLVSPSFA